MLKMLAIVPARGGSKRVPRKNLLPLHGRALLQWTVAFAVSSKMFEAVVISSDDAEITACGLDAGAVSFGLRPLALSHDMATSVDVALYELEQAEEKYGAFNYVALLQPTTPFRKYERLHDAVALLADHPDVPSVVGVSPVSAPPYHMFTLADDHSVSPLFPDHLSTRTQDLPTTVEVNGSLYLVRADALRKRKSFYFDTSRAVLCDDPRESVDIDTFEDFEAAKHLLDGTLA